MHPKVTRALIPAAGRGRRAYPKTSYMAKVMLEVDGKPLVQRNIELLRDQLGIRDFTVIVGYMAEQVTDHLGDGSALGVQIRYISCPDVDKGLASGIMLARPEFKEPFITVLGDELYLNSNHVDLVGFFDEPFDAICAVHPHADAEQIKRNYSVRSKGDMIEALVEKPTGTRTTRQLVEQGTNMRGPVRWGNIVVAKLLEVMWCQRVARFTDVGCTFRALWRDGYNRMRPVLEGVGPELSPEMMVAALMTRQRVIEVPVSYHRRVAGESKHSANYLKISRTALRMLRCIIRKRLGLMPKGVSAVPGGLPAYATRPPFMPALPQVEDV